MDYDDNVVHAMDMAAARARHGVPTGPPCVRDGCNTPSQGDGAGPGRDSDLCATHDDETNRLLDATWPPVNE